MSPHCQSPVWLQEAPEVGTSTVPLWEEGTGAAGFEGCFRRGAPADGPGVAGQSEAGGPVGRRRGRGTTGVTGDSVAGG